jgi:phosphatidate cytidylyltransferase
MIRERVLSGAIVAVLLVTVVLWVPPRVSALALTLVIGAAAWEWAGFVVRSPGARMAYVAVVAALCLAGWWLSQAEAVLRHLLWAAFVFWSLAAVWVFVLPARTHRVLVGVAGLLALSFAWLALVRMRLDWLSGSHAVLYAPLIVWLADSGAYFAGRAFGRRKLAPAVSPGKTLAGMWGGLATCALLSLAMAAGRGLPVLPLLAVTLVVCVYSVVGDLTESNCKRFAGLKDSGSLIPGHGGVLDRFDSLLAAAPLLMLGIELMPGLRP